MRFGLSFPFGALAQGVIRRFFAVQRRPDAGLEITVGDPIVSTARMPNGTLILTVQE